MLHYEFSVQELLCMALMNGFEEIWGVPNVLQTLTQEQMGEVLQKTVDQLLDKQVFTMDLDGNMTMQEDYLPVVQICCDCDRCLAVSGQKPGKEAYEVVVWACQGLYLAARVSGGIYTFYAVDEQTLESFVCWDATGSAGGASAVVSRSALRKAERHFRDGQTGDGLRVLYRDGVPENIAAVLGETMLGKAEILDLTVNRRTGTERTRFACRCIGGGGMTLEIGNQTAGFKTCVELVPADAKAVKEKLDKTLREFFAG